MKINMEFDQLDIPFDMQFGDWLPASPGDLNAVHFIPQDLTEEQQAQARENIGAVWQGDYGIIMQGQDSTVEIEVFDKPDDAGYKQTSLCFLGYEDGTVKLSRITDGTEDWDAATVRQVKETAPYLLVYDNNEDGNLVLVDGDWDTMMRELRKGRLILLVSHSIYSEDSDVSSSVYYLSFACPEDGYVVFGSFFETAARLAIVRYNGTVEFKYNNFLKLDETLSLYGNYAAPAYVVGQKLGNIDNALDTLTAHATYKNLYGRVEITADDVAAAGEEGITVITIGSDDVDLSQYNDILFRVFVPADEALNSGNKNLTIYSTSDSTYATADANILLKVQGTAISAGIIKPDKKNYFAIRANFADNNFLYGELIKHNDAGAYGYPGSSNGWVNVSSGFTKSTKKYFHIGSNGSTFKFPAGTYVEVYGR